MNTRTETAERYTPLTATRMLPLLYSIASELQSRGLELSRLVSLLVDAYAGRPEDRRRCDLIAEAAHQRREIHRVKRELESLGCTLVKRSPVTIQIPLGLSEEGNFRSLIWKYEAPEESPTLRCASLATSPPLGGE